MLTANRCALRCGYTLVTRWQLPSTNCVANKCASDVNGEKTSTFKPQRGTGDSGKSSLFTNERRWKDDAVFDCLGSIDELTCALGVCRQSLIQVGLFDLAELLLKIQCSLQDVASHVATPTPDDDKMQRSTGDKIARTAIEPTLVVEINSWINDYSMDLPPLTQFILPGGGTQSCELHVARATCRRCERTMIGLVRQKAIDKNAFTYINRLSDLLFVLARRACQLTDNQEIAHQKRSALVEPRSLEHRKL